MFFIALGRLSKKKKILLEQKLLLEKEKLRKEQVRNRKRKQRERDICNETNHDQNKNTFNYASEEKFLNVTKAFKLSNAFVTFRNFSSIMHLKKSF